MGHGGCNWLHPQPSLPRKAPRMLASPLDPLISQTLDWTSSGPWLLAACLVTSLAFGLLWWRQCRTQNATSVDAGWAAAIGGLGVAAAGLADGAAVQRWLAGGIAGIWSLRLTWHLLRDRVFGHAGEDGRYLAMRQHWGAAANRNFFFFYQAQAIAALLFAAPFLFLARNATPNLSWLQGLGLAVVIAAQLLEGAADRQLAAHRRDPVQKQRACRRGLWRYSRHPNYFFEWLTWCGVAMLAWPTAGWLAVVQPAVMFVLVRFVSGVPWTELQSLKSRGEDYRRYQQETSTLVPWWPRRHHGKVGGAG